MTVQIFCPVNVSIDAAYLSAFVQEHFLRVLMKFKRLSRDDLLGGVNS